MRSRLESSLSEKVHATAQRHGLTVNAVIHGAWTLLQSHYEARLRGRAQIAPVAPEQSPLDDGEPEGGVVVYGCTSSGRAAPLPEIEKMVGPLIRTLPVVVRLTTETLDKPFTALARDIHFQLFRSINHEALPWHRCNVCQKVRPRNKKRSGAARTGEKRNIYRSNGLCFFGPGLFSAVRYNLEL